MQAVTCQERACPERPEAAQPPEFVVSDTTYPPTANLPIIFPLAPSMFCLGRVSWLLTPMVWVLEYVEGLGGGRTVLVTLRCL